MVCFLLFTISTAVPRKLRRLTRLLWSVGLLLSLLCSIDGDAFLDSIKKHFCRTTKGDDEQGAKTFNWAKWGVRGGTEAETESFFVFLFFLSRFFYRLRAHTLGFFFVVAVVCVTTSSCCRRVRHGNFSTTNPVYSICWFGSCFVSLSCGYYVRVNGVSVFWWCMLCWVLLYFSAFFFFFIARFPTQLPPRPLSMRMHIRDLCFLPVGGVHTAT